MTALPIAVYFLYSSSGPGRAFSASSSNRCSLRFVKIGSQVDSLKMIEILRKPHYRLRPYKKHYLPHYKSKLRVMNLKVKLCRSFLALHLLKRRRNVVCNIGDGWETMQGECSMIKSEVTIASIWPAIYATEDSLLYGG